MSQTQTNQRTKSKASAQLLRRDGEHLIEVYGSTEGLDYSPTPFRRSQGFSLEFIELADAEALLMSLHAAVEGWKGIVRPSKPKTLGGWLAGHIVRRWG